MVRGFGRSVTRPVGADARERVAMDPADSALDSAGDTRNELAAMDAGRLLCKRDCLDSAARRGTKCFTWRRVVANHISSWAQFLHRQQPTSERNLRALGSRSRNADVRGADAERLAEQAIGHELSAREVSQFWMSRAWEEIRQSPSRWLQLMLAKTFMVFNRYEVPDVESMYVCRDYSWPLKLLGPLWHFGILCPLAVWGIVVTRDQWRRLWLYYLLILVMVAAVVLFFILGRYRQPLVPLLILFAAIGLCDLWRVIRDKDWSGIRGTAGRSLGFCDRLQHQSS